MRLLSLIAVFCCGLIATSVWACAMGDEPLDHFRQLVECQEVQASILKNLTSLQMRNLSVALTHVRSDLSLDRKGVAVIPNSIYPNGYEILVAANDSHALDEALGEVVKYVGSHVGLKTEFTAATPSFYVTSEGDAAFAKDPNYMPVFLMSDSGQLDRASAPLYVRRLGQLKDALDRSENWRPILAAQFPNTSMDTNVMSQCSAGGCTMSLRSYIGWTSDPSLHASVITSEITQLTSMREY